MNDEMKENFNLLGIFLGSCFIFWLAFYMFTFQARQEAAAFNRFSHTKITWWDALWADYRITPN